MSKNKIVLTTTGLLLVVSVLFTYNKYVKGYISDVIFSYQMPKNVSQTGGKITQPSYDEINKANQLYDLLDKGIIQNENFILTPYPKKRIFEVKLSDPIEVNKQLFFDWLKDNGFGDIKVDKFIFK